VRAGLKCALERLDVRARPGTLTDLPKLAQSLMREERWDDAIGVLKANSAIAEKNWRLLWNLGWCYFKTNRLELARRYLGKAAQLAPNSDACKFGLGQVYLRRKQYKRAELILSEALQIRESHAARIGLALAYLAQGKVEQAELTHVEGIKLNPKRSERYESYAAFLSDVGRDTEAAKMNRKARELRRLN
jgi:Tfp pilus assembly protein PilF